MLGTKKPPKTDPLRFNQAMKRSSRFAILRIGPTSSHHRDGERRPVARSVVYCFADELMTA